jgi:hypothetical protein
MSEIDRYSRALNPLVSRAVPPAEHVFLLQTVLLDLLTEVQALRDTLAEAPELRARYAAHYRHSMLRAHNAAGVITPLEKVIAAFVDPEGNGEGELREEGMLRKLGVDIEEYRREAEEVSMYT